MNKVFLGGTCNESTWREELIEKLTIDYFNPVVDDWTPECIQIEEDEKWKKCSYHLYTITPKMTGVYSIAEVMDSCFRQDDGCTVYCVLSKDGELEFTEGQMRSLKAVGKKVEEYNGKVFSDDLNGVAKYLNNQS